MSSADETLAEREAAAGTTRERLLAAALAIADEEGIGAVTTVNVARRVGIAQSSFYTHFPSREALLLALGQWASAYGRRANRLARRRFGADLSDHERFRDTFRVPLRDIVAHAELFRLNVRSRYEPETSPIGRFARDVRAANRADLAEDLQTIGLPDAPEARRRLEMFADCLIAMTEALALGLIDGRYDDSEEVVDLLVLLAQGPSGLLRWLAANDAGNQ